MRSKEELDLVAEVLDLRLKVREKDKLIEELESQVHTLQTRQDEIARKAIDLVVFQDNESSDIEVRVRMNKVIMTEDYSLLVNKIAVKLLEVYKTQIG